MTGDRHAHLERVKEDSGGERETERLDEDCIMNHERSETPRS